LEVAGGHTLDTLEYLLGDIADLSANMSVQRPVYTVAETGEAIETTSPDHLLLNATLTGGAAVSAHIHDAKVTDARTRLEIAGTKGDLAIVSAGPGGPAGIQIGELRLLGPHPQNGSWQDLPIPDRHRWAPDAASSFEVFNVAQLYARFAEDLRTGTRSTPDFEAGLRLHRLLDAIRRSAETGTRQTPLR
jgi:predicted dehydrogenase